MNNTQKIATLAAGLNKKPTKKAIFEMVQDIAKHDGEIVDLQLANLYAFFMPSVTKIKSPFHWLLKARGNKDVRYYLNHVYSDGKRTIATDGHRLHVINEVRKAGFYDDNNVLIHDPEWAKYPDIDRVIPSGVGEIITISDLKVEALDDKRAAYVMPDGFGMNKKYLDEALQLSHDPIIEYFEDRHVCRITHTNCKQADPASKTTGLSVVMGLKL